MPGCSSSVANFSVLACYFLLLADIFYENLSWSVQPAISQQFSQLLVLLTDFYSHISQLAMLKTVFIR